MPIIKLQRGSLSLRFLMKQQNLPPLYVPTIITWNHGVMPILKRACTHYNSLQSILSSLSHVTKEPVSSRTLYYAGLVKKHNILLTSRNTGTKMFSHLSQVPIFQLSGQQHCMTEL